MGRGGPGYLGAVERALPEAAIVFDKVLSLRSTLRLAGSLRPAPCHQTLNEAAEKIRRQEHRQLSAAGTHTLTDTKYVWRQRQENLCQRAAAEFRSLLGQVLQTGTA